MTDYILEIAGDEDLIHGRLFLTRSTGSVSRDGFIDAYFESAADRREAAAMLTDFDVKSLERDRVDWLELYQQSLKPMFIGDSFVIAPDASLLPRDGRHHLVIPQEQAFGTGSHESTALCIELLESIDMRGKRGIDIGAGSGILALAMMRLGARKAIAFDNDLDAYAALRENQSRNGIPLSAFIGGLESVRGSFDVATMNILPGVIIELLPHVRAERVIVSGVLTERRDDIVRSGRRVEREQTKGEWWAAILR